jgi:hypothetical protein
LLIDFFFKIQRLEKWLTICRSPPEPLLYVVASVEEQDSEYQGLLPFSVLLEMDRV